MDLGSGNLRGDSFGNSRRINADKLLRRDLAEKNPELRYSEKK